MNTRKFYGFFRIYFLFFSFLIFINTGISAGERLQSNDIGVDEKLGQTIPLNLTFFDEYGQPVSLKSLMNKPTILTLVYYHCAGLCNPLMAGVAAVMDKLDMKAGKDYQVITISFDPTENYVTAVEKKKNYLESMRKKIPVDSWRFLTGDQENIKKITEATGFKYEKRGNDYIHSTVIIAVSPDGKIARYLYGTDFLPFDVKMALTEASEGKSAPTITKIVQLCFSYDPAGRRYVLNITRIAGSGILLLIIAFVAFVAVKKKKGKKGSK
jgi:protein SCO1/2